MVQRILRSITSALNAAASSSRYWGIPLLVALLLGLGAHPAQGQRDQQVFFRLSRIETDVRSLQSQINQLDRQIGQQIGRLQRTGGGEVEERSPTSPPVDEPAPTYDQLATLVIETRQDMFALQERLAQLEAQLDLQSEP